MEKKKIKANLSLNNRHSNGEQLRGRVAHGGGGGETREKRVRSKFETILMK
jgi:hypothetical protein